MFRPLVTVSGSGSDAEVVVLGAGMAGMAGVTAARALSAATWVDTRAAGLRVQAISSVRNSWFTLGGNTRWLPAHLLHPGMWPSLAILHALHAAAGSDITGASFLQARGYRGGRSSWARLTLTAHLPGSTDQAAVAGLAADGVLHLERGVNHRVLDGYDLLPRHIAAGLDIRFDQRVTAIAWGPNGALVGDGVLVGLAARLRAQVARRTPSRQ